MLGDGFQDNDRPTGLIDMGTKTDRKKKGLKFYFEFFLGHPHAHEAVPLYAHILIRATLSRLPPVGRG
jgi:hypothetical protein